MPRSCRPCSSAGACAMSGYTSAKLESDRARLASVDVIELDSGHEWSDAFRAKAGEFLNLNVGRVL